MSEKCTKNKLKIAETPDRVDKNIDKIKTIGYNK